MNKTSMNKIRISGTQRALAGLMSAALLGSGLGVVSSTPAFANDAECASVQPRASRGIIGTDLKIVGADTKNFRAGDIVRITATDVVPRPGGFLVLKIDSNDKQWDLAAQSQASGLQGFQGRSDTLEIPADMFADGNLDVSVVLPGNLENGQHVISVLGGTDGGTAISAHLTFDVNNTGVDDGICMTKVIEAPTSSPEITSVRGNAADNRHGPAGLLRIKMEVPGFTAGEEATVTIGEDAFSLGTFTVGDDGVLKASLRMTEPKALAGVHKIVVTAGSMSKELTLVTTAYAEVSDGAPQGAPVTVSVANLPLGAEVVRVGTDGANWLSAPVSADDRGQVAIDNVMVPADAPFGEPVTVTYSSSGIETTISAGTNINAPSAALNVSDYEQQSVMLPTGLYQSVYDSRTDTVIVNGSNRTDDSVFYRLDAQDLSKKDEVEIAHRDDENGIFAAFGIALDTENNLLWAANSRQDAIAAYDGTTLELKKQWPVGTAQHPRDAIVDETTGKVYFSLADRDHGKVLVADPNLELDPVEISLTEDFKLAMDLELDSAKGYLYTVARNSNHVAKINVKTNGVELFTVDGLIGGTGVALDPERNELYISSQKTGETTILDADTGNKKQTIRTGATGLGVAYNPVDKRVYVANRGDGNLIAIDPATKDIVAKIPVGPLANHVNVGPDGTVYVTNKARAGVGDDRQDGFYALKLKEQTPPQSPSGNDGTSSESGLPEWATIVLSIVGSLGILAVILGGLRTLAMQLGIRLPF
ncbi:MULTISPECIES: YncE family protein [unclassified Corynebacterium]|uniref:YncE family protein n=1 Tax=unclassified Corynebacterium TaxID=2624378 RepID=UPI0021694C1D|nr:MULTISPECIES: YncE family protein [unclassified Corynebacterium]MCS4489632.1 YncE family protein [Corynebacterium sp. ES2775-CONJ]MCS4531543.1 YncE family protein [Corynebacterium sp. ES2730-CONJ]